ncbi:GNAT family N-acetyltransferase [Pseudoalteromonas mariniglutinosa]|uniref:GNAT family N-acetyltransferase n=1 Tax=Pseudoalteromonas sp. S1727 TaxID=2066514 RepID=UPI001486C610|nr:GNAT family N-acetyltransferase [Pseudoalteromonas sp. S1727]
MRLSQLANYAVHLNEVKASDCERVWQWRNLEHVRTQMKNRDVIEWEHHQQWFNTMLTDTRQQHFIINYKTTAIGVINIHAQQNLETAEAASIGLYISDTQYLNNILAFAPSLVMLDYAFNDLNILHLNSEVRRENKAAIRYNQQLGYRLSEQSSDNHMLLISLNQLEFEQATTKIKHFLNRG